MIYDLDQSSLFLDVDFQRLSSSQVTQSQSGHYCSAYKLAVPRKNI